MDRQYEEGENLGQVVIPFQVRFFMSQHLPGLIGAEAFRKEDLRPDNTQNKRREEIIGTINAIAHGDRIPGLFPQAQEIDEEIHKLIERSYNKAKEILLENKEKHAQLAQQLLDREVIFAEDLEKIFGKRPFGQQNDNKEASQENTPNNQEEDKKENVNSPVNNNGDESASDEEAPAQQTV